LATPWIYPQGTPVIIRRKWNSLRGDQHLMKTAKQLAVAAGQGDLKAMHALLDQDPALAKDWQPMMEACFNGQVSAVELLLERGADPNILSKSSYRYRPLHRAIEHKATFPRNENHVAVVRLLLEHGADPLLSGAYDQISAVAMAACRGDHRFLPLLLERVRELDVFTAAVLGNLERVRELLVCTPSLVRAVDRNGWSALRYCCYSRLWHDDPATAEALKAIARLLLDQGAPLEGCLEPVILLNNAALTALLLQRGAVLRDGDILSHAACDGAHDALDLVVDYGTDLNMTNGTEHHGGYTPFGCTLTMRSQQGAQWFLDRGLDPNYVGGKEGESSLHVAVRSGAGPQLLKLLVDRGADPNARDAAGMTPLAAARARERKSAVEFLTGLGAEG
jgi:ankyrin repeat protein